VSHDGTGPPDEETDTSGTSSTAHPINPYGPERSPFRPKPKRPPLERLVPVSQEIADYGGSSLRRDLLAGLTVAALALPSAMAYGELAGVTPVAGLYALLLPSVVYTILGSSRQLIIGPEGSVVALVATALLPIAGADPVRYASLAALLAVLVGIVFLCARLIRLGWVADYLSRAVLIGYIHGVAVVLIVSQLPKLLGLSVGAREPIPQLVEIARDIDEASGRTLAVGSLSLLALLLLRVMSRRFPGPLVVVMISIVASFAFSFVDHGIAIVGTIPSGLPSFAIPSFRLGDIVDLLPAAIGIFFVSYSDAILTPRSFAGSHDQHVRADQELFAFGLANIAAGFTQSFSIGASNSRTAVNDQMGGRTQFSGLFAAGWIAIVLLFLTGPMQYLPKATLGAVIVAAGIGLIEPIAWRALARTSRFELMIGIVTTVGVVILGVLQALVIALLLSIVDVVRRSATPHDAVLGWVDRIGRYANVRTHPSAVLTPGVVVYRLDDRLFFANAAYAVGRIREAIDGAPYPVRWFVFDAESLTHVDSTGMEALRGAIEQLARDQITFVFARLKGLVRGQLGGAGIIATVGAEHLFPTVHAAVDAARRSL
jgi:SulP family sulfate permease